MNGRLIVFEGTDGSGKATQSRLLCEHLRRENIPYKNITFPRYGKPSAAMVQEYLDGHLGKHPGDVNAYAASLMFSMDRYASYKQDWGAFYEAGGLVVADRYTTSNAVHQTTKEPPEKRQAFLHWLYDFEYDRLGLPRPDLVIYLDVPTDFTEKLLRSREAATHTQADIHEQDVAYLENCLRIGRLAAAHYGWTVVPFMKDGAERELEEKHEEIFSIIRSAL